MSPIIKKAYHDFCLRVEYSHHYKVPELILMLNRIDITLCRHTTIFVNEYVFVRIPKKGPGNSTQFP
jgi:hypothetical protein